MRRNIKHIIHVVCRGQTLHGSVGACSGSWLLLLQGLIRDCLIVFRFSLFLHSSTRQFSFKPPHSLSSYSKHISWSFTSISTPFIPASHGHNSKPHLNLSARHSPRESSNIHNRVFVTDHKPCLDHRLVSVCLAHFQDAVAHLDLMQR